MRVAELETLFTADITDAQKKSAKVDATMKALVRSDPVVKVDANVVPALAGMERVQDSAKKITAAGVVKRIDADITKATTKTENIKTQLAVLESLPVDVTITADIAKAQKALATTETRLKALQGARAEMTVAADTGKAEAGIGRAKTGLKEVDGATATFKVKADTSKAKADIGGLGSEGGKAGAAAGEGLSAGIIAALATIPVAGAVIGIGAAIGKSLTDGLQVEVRSDRLMATTGLDAETIAPIARAAGEAYAGNFGVSIASNMETAKTAMQGGLLDPDGTERDSQTVIESLSGVADILGEEIPAVSRATAQLLRTGLAKDAAGAFDLLVKGTHAGLNVSEDLIDTVNEYSTQFRKLGLDGPQAFGLLAQAVRGGARDTDVAADSLKEFAIRAVDGSKTTTDGFKAIGLSAKDMAADIAKGGPEASAALGLTLTKLREMEPGAARSAAAVALFGTQAEDMGNALFTMDLSTAVQQLGNVEGAAKTAIATLGDNTAGKLESARRNIEVASDGIKGALATAFAPQLEGMATFVTTNRAAVMQFLLDMANGAIDAGRALANAAANGIEGFGSMIGYVGPALLSMIGGIIRGFAMVATAMDPTGILGIRDAAQGALQDFNGFRAGAEQAFAAADAGSKIAADAIRNNLIANGLDPAQAKLNALGVPMVAQAALHDASVYLASGIDKVGYASDGSKLKLDTLNGTVGQGSAASILLGQQITSTVAALDAEAQAAAAAGEDQGALNLRYNEGRTALVNQLVQMGYTGAQAKALADKYRAIPGKAETKAVLDDLMATAKLTALRIKITGLPDGVVSIGSTGYAQVYNYLSTLQRMMRDINGKQVRIAMGPGGQGGQSVGANGLQVRAANGLDRQSMIAPGGANILWAEPEVGWETYISGKPSQRARNIRLLSETARRFGMTVAPVGQGQPQSSASPPAAGSPLTDMSGVRADLAEQNAILRNLLPGFAEALNGQARTVLTMQRLSA